jgi:hypothetical protein
MKKFVRMFQPKFSDLVKSGIKRQTIRRIPERMPKKGDEISLRVWKGTPYRSRQQELRKSKIKEVSKVDITETSVIVNGYAEPSDEFAVADGFKDFFEMTDWFKKSYGLPFEGILIKW